MFPWRRQQKALNPVLIFTMNNKQAESPLITEQISFSSTDISWKTKKGQCFPDQEEAMVKTFVQQGPGYKY